MKDKQNMFNGLLYMQYHKNCNLLDDLSIVCNFAIYVSLVNFASHIFTIHGIKIVIQSTKTNLRIYFSSIEFEKAIYYINYSS